MISQKEGYVKIPRKLFDAIVKTKLSLYERNLVLTIICFSYGWNKKEAKLTYKQISEYSGIDITNIPRTLRSLQAKNIIKKEGRIYSIQDCELWHVNKSEETELNKFEETYLSLERLNFKSVETYNFKSVETHGNGKKSNKINNLQSANNNNIKKNIYINISQRDKVKEKILSELKKYFPKANFSHTPTPTDKIDYLLYLIEQNIVVPSEIRDPVRYVQSSKLVPEPFPPFEERQRRKQAMIEAKLEAKRKEEEERAMIDREENKKRIQELIYSITRKGWPSELRETAIL